MFSPKRIRLVDFMSHEDSVIEFNEGKTTLIYGVNLDDEGADSNGSGKSAIVKAITIGLLDVPDSNLNKEDYIRDGCDTCHIELVLFNEVQKLELKIERSISKSGSKVKIYENGVQNRQLTSVKECNERVLELLDIDKKDILNYFFINQDNSHSFFEATDTEQKQVISRFINSSVLDDAIQSLEQEYKTTQEEKNDICSKIDSGKTRIETLTESLNFELEGRGDQHQEELNDSKEQLDNLIDKQRKNLEKIKDETIRLQQIDLSLGKLKEKSASEINENLDKLTRRRKKYRLEHIEASDLLLKVEQGLSGVIECPSCGHKWSPRDLEQSIEELESLKAEIPIILDELSNKGKSIKKKIDSLSSELDGVIRNNNTIKNLKSERQRVSQNIDSLNAIIGSISKNIEESRLVIKRFKEFKIDQKRISEIRSQIEAECELLEKREEHLSLIDSDLELLTFWKINLGIKGFKSYLVNSTLSNLEKLVNIHLNQFKTDLRVKINGFKKNKSGDIIEKIDILVSRDGDNWKKYKRHSGGQRQRINVCGILTIQKLINGSSNTGGLDLLLLDEFFEGLDSSGQHEILNILSMSKTTTLVISHNNNDVGAQNRIDIEYKDRVSKIRKS